MGILDTSSLPAGARRRRSARRPRRLGRRDGKVALCKYLVRQRAARVRAVVVELQLAVGARARSRGSPRAALAGALARHRALARGALVVVIGEARVLAARPTTAARSALVRVLAIRLRRRAVRTVAGGVRRPGAG